MEIRALAGEQEYLQALELFIEIEPELTLENGLAVLRSRLSKGAFLFGVVGEGEVLSASYANEKVLLTGERLFWIGYLVTKASRRSEGLGSRLMSFMEDFARKQGFSQLRVHSAHARFTIHSFYTEHLGFEDWAKLFVKVL